MMGPILLVKIYSSKKMCEFSELSTITVDPPESNTTGSGDLTTEESMWHSLYFEILQNKKGCVFGVAFRRLLTCLTTEPT